MMGCSADGRFSAEDWQLGSREDRDYARTASMSSTEPRVHSVFPSMASTDTRNT